MYGRRAGNGRRADEITPKIGSSTPAQQMQGNGRPSQHYEQYDVAPPMPTATNHARTSFHRQVWGGGEDTSTTTARPAPGHLPQVSPPTSARFGRRATPSSSAHPLLPVPDDVADPHPSSQGFPQAQPLSAMGYPTGVTSYDNGPLHQRPSSQALPPLVPVAGVPIVHGRRAQTSDVVADDPRERAHNERRQQLEQAQQEADAARARKAEAKRRQRSEDMALEQRVLQDQAAMVAREREEQRKEREEREAKMAGAMGGGGGARRQPQGKPSHSNSSANAKSALKDATTTEGIPGAPPPLPSKREQILAQRQQQQQQQEQQQPAPPQPVAAASVEAGVAEALPPWLRGGGGGSGVIPATAPPVPILPPNHLPSSHAQPQPYYDDASIPPPPPPPVMPSQPWPAHEDSSTGGPNQHPHHFQNYSPSAGGGGGTAAAAYSGHHPYSGALDHHSAVPSYSGGHQPHRHHHGYYDRDSAQAEQMAQLARPSPYRHQHQHRHQHHHDRQPTPPASAAPPYASDPVHRPHHYQANAYGGGGLGEGEGSYDQQFSQPYHQHPPLAAVPPRDDGYDRYDYHSVGRDDPPPRRATQPVALPSMGLGPSSLRYAGASGGGGGTSRHDSVPLSARTLAPHAGAASMAPPSPSPYSSAPLDESPRHGGGGAVFQNAQQTHHHGDYTSRNNHNRGYTCGGGYDDDDEGNGELECTTVHIHLPPPSQAALQF